MPMLEKISKFAPKKKVCNATSRDILKRNGIDIDTVVRNSLNCAVKNNLNRLTRNTRDCLSELNRLKLLKTENKYIKNDQQENVTLKKLQETLKKRGNNNTSLNTNALTIKNENVSSAEKHLDDSLTSLQWLTDVKINDILEGKPITYAPPSPAPSNTSDDNDDKRYVTRDGRCFSESSADYRVNSNIKPPYSYAALIVMAMKSKSCAKMTLAEIYKWITDNFQFYKQAEQSWQNSIRHNLSLNKCFAKIPRSKGDPGKGGYWRVIPEYANKLLETNVRKRRTSMYDYGCRDIIKRQRLDMLENRQQFLYDNNLEIKPELVNDIDMTEQSFYHNSNNNNRLTPVHVLADLDHCRMDHPYGKNPFAKYEVTDEEHIKALADNLKRSSSDLQADLSDPETLQSIANAMRSDCIWSSHPILSDNLTESMSKVTEELLQARNHSTDNEIQLLVNKNLGNSLNSSGRFLPSPFSLSPPLSGDGERFSDELEEENEPPVFSDDINLTIRGTSMKLYIPTPDMMDNIKEEILSPQFAPIEE